MFWRQFKVVVKKNVIVKRHHLSDLLLEFLVPVLVIIGLWSIRLAITAKVTEESVPNESYNIETFDDLFVQPQCQKETLLWNCATLEDTECDVFDYKTHTWEGCLMKKIGVAPADSTDAGQVRAAKDFIAFTESSLTQFENVSLFTYFESESDFIQHVRLEDYSRDTANIQVYSSAVIFNSAGPQWDYSVRLNKSMAMVMNDFVDGKDFPSTEELTNIYLKTADETPSSSGIYEAYPFLEGYLRSGLFTLVNHVNTFVATQTCRARGLCNATEQVEVRTAGLVDFPNIEIKQDSFWANVGPSFALLMILSVLYPISNMIKSLVAEKESRLKEGMLMMSLESSVLAATWVFHFFVLFCLLAVALMLAGQGLFQYSEKIFIFLYFMTFFTASMAFCFLVSTLISRAKTASIVGCFVYFMGYFIYIGLGGDATLSHSQLMLACLHPTAAFTYGTLAFMEYEDARIGVTTHTWTTSEQYDISFADTIIMQCINTLYLGFLTWYLSQVWRSEFGLAKPWYFLFQPSYWRALWPARGCKVTPVKRTTQGEKVRTDDRDDGVEMSKTVADKNIPNGDDGDEDQEVPVEEVTSNMRKQIEDNECVHIAGLKKSFATNTGKKVAVDGLNMTFYSGQITALLGHNGAGKSTTVSMLSGLYPPDEGRATIAGFDIGTDMHEARKLLGVCPQHDVLLPDLTVAEHMEFFAGIKGCPPEEIAGEVDRLVKSVGLVEKRNVRAKFLSGGQKRKLSVAIAFIGNSKIVILDEPTSGMDPYSRRFTWNVIRQHREGRVIILVTHFMDEADLLGDRIAIMGDGKLLCCGSSLFLKKKYGVGYNMTIEKKHPKEFDTTAVMKVISEAAPAATILTDVGTELTVQLPFASSQNFESLFSTLDDSKEELRMASYGMSVTTMEEVFLRVAAGTETINTQEAGVSGVVHGEDIEDGGSKVNAPVSVPLGDTETVAGDKGGSGDKTLAKYEGSLFLRHMLILLKKRYLYFSRDTKSWLFQYVLPVLFVIIGGILMKIQTFSVDQRSLAMSHTLYNGGVSVHNYPLPYSSGVCSWYPDCPVYPDALATSLMQSTQDASNLPTEWRPGYSTFGNMSRFLLDDREAYEASRYGAVSFQLIETQSGGGGGPAVMSKVEYYCHGNFSGVHSTPVTSQLVADAVVRSLDPGASLVMRLHPLPDTKAQEDTFGQWSLTNLVTFVALAIAFVPAGMVSFVVYEKETKSRHQQMVSGVSVHAYWLSTWLWDSLGYQVTAWMMIIVIVSFKDDTAPLTSAEAFPWTVALLMLFGPAVSGAVYLFSYALKTSSGSQIVVIFIMIVQGLIFSIAGYVLRLIPSTTDVYMNTIRYILVLLPPFAVIEGLINLALREFFSSSELGGLDVYAPGDMKMTGLNVMVLAIEAVVFISVQIGLDYVLLKPQLLSALVSKKDPPPLGEGRDEDVLEEDRQVAAGAINENNSTVLLKDMTKMYAGGKYAVRGVSLGIPMGQCFGLLGVNGAGKSSLLNILSGEFPPTSGDAFISGTSLVSNVDKCRKSIGFCPQFDALYDLLTGREHLEFYAAIKGIRSDLVPAVAEAKLREMGLVEYADRESGGYSGGNKRKLSVAMAMIGDPSIVFLDEPSTGMDPVARRFMWRVISDVVTNREQCSLILTTHSMEECEALCTRIAIMVDGVFRCLGSSQRLRSRYGLGYQIELLLKVPSDEEVSVMAADFLAAVRKEGATGDSEFTRTEAETALTVIDEAAWASRFTEHGSGADIFSSFLQSDTVACTHLASWCILEKRYELLETFFAENFEGFRVRERQVAKVRVEVPLLLQDGTSRKLSSMFGLIERSVSNLHVLEYSISQTSLEQIFNSFASQQTGETL